MSRVERISRECIPGQLPADLYQVIQKYFQDHKLGDPETEARLCCETVTTRQPTARWITLLEGNPDAKTTVVMLLTPEWLVWARSSDHFKPMAAGIRLKTLRIKIMQSHKEKEFLLEIAGFMNDTKEYMRGTLELGAQPAAQKFSEAVNEAALAQNPTPAKSGRRWFGVK